MKARAPIVAPPFQGLLDGFTAYMADEQGLSPYSVRSHGWKTKTFLAPSAPSWGDVEAILASLATDRAVDIRRVAALLLFATYGFRVGEVAGLTLDDLDWEHEVIRLRRVKSSVTTCRPTRCPRLPASRSCATSPTCAHVGAGATSF